MQSVTITSLTSAAGRGNVAMTAEMPGLPALSMLESDGLVLSRSPWAGGGASGEVPGPAGLLLHRSRLVRTALDLAEHHPRVGPIVIWPDGVPLDLTALALATATVLQAHRTAGAPPPVVCPVRPPMGRARMAIRHQVRADLGGDAAVELIVWEPLVSHPAVTSAAA
ncbi:hypothetical protein [Pseudofrankia sp. DC12]|uniref:hypothetical protein n=1 Tax=Pseudofrankia sp. DC12 TaxID=683315 RepID=UPI0006988D28|nr:hypothetical protein [Pseudofrankia sp. DC12]